MSNLKDYYLSLKPLDYISAVDIDEHATDCYAIPTYSPYVLGFTWGVPAGFIKSVRLIHDPEGLLMSDQALHAKNLGVSIPWNIAFDDQRDKDLQQSFDSSLLLQYASGKPFALPINTETQLYLQLVYDSKWSPVTEQDDATIVFGWYGHRVVFDNSDKYQNTVHFINHPMAIKVKHFNNTIAFEIDSK